MNDQYYQKKNNKKAFLLLLVLGGVGFLGFKFSNVEETVADFSKDTEESSCSSCNGIVDNSYEDNEAVFINLLDEESDTPSVQGIGTLLKCLEAKNTYTADSACTIPLSTGTVSLQGWVSSTADIKLVSMMVPIIPLSGSYEVESNIRKISEKTGNYGVKPAGAQFDDKQWRYNATPGEGVESLGERILSAIQKKAFGVKYTVSTEAEEGDGEASISEYAPNNGGEEFNNPENINPDKSNRIADWLKDIYYDYPGEVDVEDNESIKIEGVCEGIEEVEIDSNSETQCFNVWNALVNTFGSLFPSSDWASCNAKEEDGGCIKSEDIVVKMSPMFEETNNFMLKRNKTAMDPETALSYQPHYIITKCTADVSGKLVDVKCLWDMTYIFEERKAAEYDDAGGSDTPSEYKYIKYLKEESIRRTDTLPYGS